MPTRLTRTVAAYGDDRGHLPFYSPAMHMVDDRRAWVVGWLATGHVAILWDAIDGVALREVGLVGLPPGERPNLGALAFASEGGHLAWACGGRVSVFDLAAGEVVWSSEETEATEVSLSADGRRVAYVRRQQAVVIDRATGETLAHAPGANHARISDSGRLLAVATEGALLVLDLDVRQTTTFEGLSRHARVIAVAPDDARVITAGNRWPTPPLDEMTLWSLPGRCAERAWRVAFPWTRPRAARVQRDGRALWLHADKQLLRVDLDDGEARAFPVCEPAYYVALAVEPDGRWALCERTRNLSRWEPGAASEHAWRGGHDAAVTALCERAGPPGILAGDASGHIRVWGDPMSEALVLEEGADAVAALATSPDGRVAFSLHAHGLRSWDLASGDRLSHVSKPDWHARTGHGLQLQSALAASPDGARLLVCARDSFWGWGVLADLAFDPLHTPELHRAYDVGFTADGLHAVVVTRAVSGLDVYHAAPRLEVRFFEPASGRLAFRVPLPGASPPCWISRDGDAVLCLREGAWCVLAAHHGRRRHALGPSPIQPGGSELVALGARVMIRAVMRWVEVWPLPPRGEPAVVELPTVGELVTSLLLLRDESAFCVGTSEGFIYRIALELDGDEAP